MGDQLEARISVVEHIQKEFGHEIREIKKELARLAKLVEDRAEEKVVLLQEFSPFSTQPFLRFGQHPNPRPSILIASNEACRLNLQPPLDTSKIAPVYIKASISSNQSSSLENHLKGPKASRNRIRWTRSPLHMLSYSLS